MHLKTQLVLEVCPPHPWAAGAKYHFIIQSQLAQSYPWTLFRLLYVHLLKGKSLPSSNPLSFLFCSDGPGKAMVPSYNAWPSFSCSATDHQLAFPTSLRCSSKLPNWQWKPAALPWIPLKGATETHLAILTNSVCRVEVVQTLGAHRLTVLLILGRKTPCNKGVGLWGQSCQGSTLNRWERWSCMDTAYWREQNSSIRTLHQPVRSFTWDIISFTWLPLPM